MRANQREQGGEHEQAGPVAFGALLKRYRALSHLTQEALAERANISTRAVSDLERGLSRAPRYDTLDMLASALGLSPEQRASFFAAARPAVPVEEGPAPSLQALPFPPTALVGREEELGRALSLLRDQGVRLLTVKGPGGVGKTRLALQVAHELRATFPDGLAYIDLTAIRDPSLVPQLAAQTLGLKEEAGRPFAEVARGFLRDRHFLLVLDNFEHVLAGAGFVADLLAGCRRLQILVTSRVRLHLRAEHQLLLAPLPLEAAMALFYERARIVQPFLPDDPSTVTAICERVDRLPLAIELAAVHAGMLPLPLLLERLSNRLPLLRAGARDLPERQRTMHEAIDWSYSLLNAEGQRTFRALSVFTAGCSLEAAEAICGEQGSAPSSDVLPNIAALVDASLLQVVGMANSVPRYSMLGVIGDYALEQLRASGEEEKYRRRHAEYFAELAERASRVGPAQSSGPVQLEQESPNGRAALEWTYERGEGALGLRLATWFAVFWITRGQMSEAALWLERMLALDTAAGEQAAPPVLRTKGLLAAARVALHLGERDRAAVLAEEALSLAQRAGDQADMSSLLGLLGSMALGAGKIDDAGALFEESFAAAKHASDTSAMMRALLNLGDVARKRGEVTRATDLLEQVLALARASNFIWGIANTLTLLGHLAREQGDYERAKARYRQSLTLYEKLVNATYAAWCLEGVAGVACAEAHYKRAAKLSAAAAALRAGAHTPLPPVEQEAVDKIVMTARAELGEKNFTEEWEAGLRMTLGDAVSYAMR